MQDLLGIVGARIGSIIIKTHLKFGDSFLFHRPGKGRTGRPPQSAQVSTPGR